MFGELLFAHTIGLNIYTCQVQSSRFSKFKWFTKFSPYYFNLILLKFLTTLLTPISLSPLSQLHRLPTNVSLPYSIFLCLFDVLSLCISFCFNWQELNRSSIFGSYQPNKRGYARLIDGKQTNCVNNLWPNRLRIRIF